MNERRASVAGSESRIYQGRQHHQWFGHGTKPKDDVLARSGLEGLDQRIMSLASTAVASLKPSQRSHPAARFDALSADKLVVATRAWVANLGRGNPAFADRMLGLSAAHPAVEHLREVTPTSP